MIKKYTRKQINQQAPLHNLEFVKSIDCEKMLQLFVESAIEAGADADKLMGGVNYDNLHSH